MSQARRWRWRWRLIVVQGLSLIVVERRAYRLARASPVSGVSATNWISTRLIAARRLSERF